MAFQAKTVDYQLSPYTGLTRDSWIEAGKYMLTGIFQHISSAEDPVIVPRKEMEVSYPNEHTPEWKKQAEIFEGLARSFFIAAPLIQDNPDLVICGYSMRDYYKKQILRSCTPGDPNYVLDLSYMQATEALRDPFNTYQQTVETCALVICLWICKGQIWDLYTKEEKDIIAAFLTDYAHGNTVPHNWRLFNMLDLAFLHHEGYPIDQDIMREHAQVVLNYYAGDGWYRDGHSFDYYSCWAFNVYGPIWNQMYGYEYEPYLAQKFEENSNKLMETYADFFDRDGFTNMWGRSNIYRNASTSAFDGNLFLHHPTADPGLSRRICSGSLLQFLSREDVFYEGVPTLGFYGQFTPLVQGYSCAESPFWIGKAFLCLHLPKDHPFWTAKEHNGSWENLKKNEVKVTTLNGPALCYSNHEANGSTILRTGKVLKELNNDHDMWNYSKLTFHTKFPWEAAPSAEVESQQYVVKDLTFDKVKKSNITFWCGEQNGVLYRRQLFAYSPESIWHCLPAMDLADFTVPYGILRVDKIRLHQKPVSVTLGSYGFPDNQTEIIRKEKNGWKAVILKGHDHIGQEKQMAMTLFAGWDEIELLHSHGTNPDSEESVVIYGKLTMQKQYGYDPCVLISQVITKESLEDFTEEELFPIQSITFTDPQQYGGYGPVQIELLDGTKKVIDYEGIEGKLQL